MPYQKPKADHPWRQYKNKYKKTKAKNIIPIKEFLVTIVENWESYEVVSGNPIEGSYYHKISNMSQAKSASWLAGMLRRHYVEKNREPIL